MPDYREVKKPAGLVGAKLTKEEQATVDVGGNEAAIGTDLTEAKHGSQLDLWYRDGRTLIRAARNGKTVQCWSLKGYVSPHDCREWYLASTQASNSSGVTK